MMKKLEKNPDQLNGLIDKGCSLEGKLAFDGVVQVNGDFRGEVVSDGTLVVGPEANVEARIQVGTLVLEGSVRGAVDAKTKIELHKGAKLIADVATPTLVVEEGATFHGNCNMIGDEARQVVAQGQQAVQAPDGTYTEDSLMM